MRYARKGFHSMERAEGTREKVHLNVANSMTGKALSLPCESSATWGPSRMLVHKSVSKKNNQEDCEYTTVDLIPCYPW